MRPIPDPRPRRALALTLLALTLWPTGAARGETASELATEIARLRSRMADNSAQEQRCLAGATQPVWTASLATDLQALQDRANQAAEGSSPEAQRWKELARKVETLQARAAVSGRTGAELFQSQQIGLDCLDRYADEREALRASLEMAVADPAAYGDSIRRLREDGGETLRRDLAELHEQSRALSTRWKQTRSEAGAGVESLKFALDALRRRHTVALESAPARGLADPILRAAEALVAAAGAWERERRAGARLGGARDDSERRMATKERDEAARVARDYWATADRLIARRVPALESTRTGTASPGAGGTP